MSSYLRYVKIVGTMHVSPDSKKTVEALIEAAEPDAVALELDSNRFIGMVQGRKAGLSEALREGRLGLLNYALYELEKKIGEEMGMNPGEEMMAAYRKAVELGVPVYLIDQDIKMTLSKIMEAPLKEKLGMIVELVLGLAGLMSQGDELEDIDSLIMEFRERYPHMYRVLIEERNVNMARNLISIVDELMIRGIKKPLVVAVVGMAHVKGIEHTLSLRRI